ncbi:MAG: hypothetical protein A3C53_02825 [Omnitrophica WOR_2 bacterium RIFCSPHIGHO2_02_FULL_68_15]|nr:MAG: hypothetical protein A3C53_02825 [Omnitrophica WOR_2 bacterium RIFCSPHIGHO2_02_FULL_68_15]
MILDTSAAVVVTGDSVSMVSEAAATTKPVFVIAPRQTWPQPKRRRFFADLTATGRVQVVAPSALAAQLTAAVRDARPMAPLDDRAHLLTRLVTWL